MDVNGNSHQRSLTRSVPGLMLGILLFLVSLSISCDSDDFSSRGQSSTEFGVCNNLLAEACLSPAAPYCLFGLKWGEDADFDPIGPDVQGPGSTATISFSFQESNGRINTHREVNVPSLDFSLLPECAKNEVRKALSAWEDVANISFTEEDTNAPSDIRIFASQIRQSAVAFPNFQDDKCAGLGGQVVLNPFAGLEDCQTLYLIALHEIGHALGLGHVSTRNIMNGDSEIILTLSALQAGDSLGLRQIYGEK